MLEELVYQGERIKQSTGKGEQVGDDFEIWLNKCISYIETYHGQSSITKKFLNVYESGTQSNDYYFSKMLNIIKAFKETEDSEANYDGTITNVYD